MSADHSLHLDGDPRWNWRLSCDHEPGGRWASYENQGDAEPVSEECWLRSWWDELGLEMLKDAPDVWDGVTSVPIPLDHEGDGWSDGPLLVPWTGEAECDVTDCDQPATTVIVSAHGASRFHVCQEHGGYRKAISAESTCSHERRRSHGPPLPRPVP